MGERCDLLHTSRTSLGRSATRRCHVTSTVVRSKVGKATVVHLKVGRLKF